MSSSILTLLRGGSSSSASIFTLAPATFTARFLTCLLQGDTLALISSSSRFNFLPVDAVWTFCLPCFEVAVMGGSEENLLDDACAFQADDLTRALLSVEVSSIKTCFCPPPFIFCLEAQKQLVRPPIVSRCRAAPVSGHLPPSCHL